MENGFTALVIGATGLVGSQLVSQLLEDPNWQTVCIYVRKQTGISHPKLVEHLVDFDQPENWADLLKGDALFCCLGTTLKKAGSKKAQYNIDYGYQFNTAKAAANNGTAVAVLVSSAGANASSMFFYNRMKGALDEAVSNLPFCSIRILRPSLLDGKRHEQRIGEQVALKLTRGVVKYIPVLKNWRPVPAQTVAAALRESALSALTNDIRKKIIYRNEDIFELVQ